MRALFLAVGLAFATHGASAATVTFDFESFARGDVIGALSQNGLSATVTATGGIDAAVAFDTENFSGGDDDLAAPLTDLAGSPGDFGKVAIVQENGRRDAAGALIPDDNARGGTLSFLFSRSVAFVAVDILDVEEPGVDIFLDDVRILANAGRSADHRFAHVSNLNPNLLTGRELRFVFQGSGAIDNIQVSSVPLPAGGLLLLSSVLGLGAARRLRAT